MVMASHQRAIVRSGQHVATSATDPTACHLVDAAFGCTCRGYQQWARCMHYGLLLSHLGLILDQVEPASTAA